MSLTSALVGSWGCGKAATEPSQPPVAQAARPEKAPLPKGSLRRDEVVAVVDEGLGSFLGRVQVEPSLDKGRFQGFRILALEPENFWRDVDLRAGDVVLAVNGTSVEQPTAAFDVFESLRTASKLEVSVLRAGAHHQLSFAIVGAPRPKTKQPPAAGQGPTKDG
jgi:type II secretory pathway component PulC